MLCGMDRDNFTLTLQCPAVSCLSKFQQTYNISQYSAQQVWNKSCNGAGISYCMCLKSQVLTQKTMFLMYLRANNWARQVFLGSHKCTFYAAWIRCLQFSKSEIRINVNVLIHVATQFPTTCNFLVFVSRWYFPLIIIIYVRQLLKKRHRYVPII